MEFVIIFITSGQFPPLISSFTFFLGLIKACRAKFFQVDVEDPFHSEKDGCGMSPLDGTSKAIIFHRIDVAHGWRNEKNFEQKTSGLWIERGSLSMTFFWSDCFLSQLAGPALRINLGENFIRKYSWFILNSAWKLDQNNKQTVFSCPLLLNPL